jgi:glycosyltransferase involved in cell wall biosynthesis
MIAPYLQSDGWGEAARAYVKALATTEHNITLRPIYMANNIKQEVDPLFEKLEHNTSLSYDVVIQKVLPHLLETTIPDSKNISLCVFETANLQHTSWTRFLNRMDEAWTTSQREQDILIESGLTTNIAKVNEPTDIDIYTKEYDSGPLKHMGLNNTFNFYFVGEYIPRKNLMALATAFHREFKPSEPVSLVIKTNKAGMDQKQLQSKIDKDLTGLKKTLLLYQNPHSYKRELVATEYLKEEYLYALHQACDCFVMPSYGEACCRPMMDAIGFGNPVIVTSNTGMTDYVLTSDENHYYSDIGWIVSSRQEPVHSNEHPLPFLYTGWETWSSIDILSLQKAMREAYELNDLQRLQMKHRCQEHIKRFSYKNIGDKINKLL